MNYWKKEEKMKIINKLKDRYRKASKKEKGIILNELLHLTNYNRKYAGWLLRNAGRRVFLKRKGKKLVIFVGEIRKKKRRKRAKRKIYDKEVLEALKEIWRVSNFLCGKRLAPFIPEIIPQLEASGRISPSDSTREKLLRISAATVDRLLKDEKRKVALEKHRGRPKIRSLVMRQIPIRAFSELENPPPGYIDIDLVYHAGGNPGGDFIHTLSAVDIATDWFEAMAVKNRAQVWTFEALKAMEKRFPFPIIEIHSDNGVEFINAHLLKYCQMTGKKFTRSRPYRKNDNCYIEQKNGSIIRKFVGHARYTTEEELNILNELYGYLRLYVNFFQPTMKLIKKERIGSKVKRKYDTPKTPFQRILSSPHISEELKESLKKEYQSLNIAELWKKIYKYANQLLDIAEKRKGTCINEKILEEFGIETKVRQQE